MLSARSRLAVGALRASARDVVLTIAIAFSLATGSIARADDVDAARKTFAEGVKLYQKGDYEGARRLFKQADAEHHAPPIVYNLALAEEKLNHPQAAIDAYEAYVAEVGDKGDLAPAAAVAIAQIKARSTKLRVETKPPGARVFVDGAPLAEPSPVAVLVPAGHHVVVAQGDGWRVENDVTAEGKGDALTVTLVQQQADAAPPVVKPVEPERPPPALPLPAPAQPPTLPPPPEEADGLVWGAAFAIMPCYLLGVDTREKTPAETAATSNARDAASIVAGPLLEIGWALSSDFVFLARGTAGIGPDAKPSYAFMGGPGLSLRVGSRVWLGATFLGGQLETKAFDARYGTDLVFGTMIEANAVVLKKSHGEWIAGIQPAFLLTRRDQDNTTFFFPLTFGYRAF